MLRFEERAVTLRFPPLRELALEPAQVRAAPFPSLHRGVARRAVEERFDLGSADPPSALQGRRRREVTREIVHERAMASEGEKVSALLAAWNVFVILKEMHELVRDRVVGELSWVDPDPIVFTGREPRGGTGQPYFQADPIELRKENPDATDRLEHAPARTMSLEGARRNEIAPRRAREREGCP